MDDYLEYLALERQRLAYPQTETHVASISFGDPTSTPRSSTRGECYIRQHYPNLPRNNYYACVKILRHRVIRILFCHVGLSGDIQSNHHARGPLLRQGKE
jgi:hypothetical protein